MNSKVNLAIMWIRCSIHGGTHSKRHGYHRLVCKTFPFSVFYEMESENSLVIVAVFGQRRGAEWIANRLKNDGG